jgi:hypothetical protein
VWHAPGARYRHRRACFDVLYQANSYGMRDVERQRVASSHRVVVLGDSMIEGFGVNREERLSDLLERSTGVPHLNFGTAGDFGPTQYYLLYKYLAKSFSHDTVMIGLFPYNDFRDDDLQAGKRMFPDRYRPYWAGTYPDYRLVYYRPQLAAERARGEDPEVTPASVLGSFTYSYHVLGLLKRIAHARHAVDYSGFYDFTQEQLLRAEYSLHKLREEAEDRRVILVLLPVQSDLERFQERGPSPLAARLARFAQAENIELIDLLPVLARQTRDPAAYYLRCDGHFSPHGNQAAHDVVERTLALGQGT